MLKDTGALLVFASILPLMGRNTGKNRCDTKPGYRTGTSDRILFFIIVLPGTKYTGVWWHPREGESMLLLVSWQD